MPPRNCGRRPSNAIWRPSNVSLTFHAVSSSTPLTPSSRARKGAARLYAEVDKQAIVRRPESWAMLLSGETLTPAWRHGGRVLWHSLGASFWFLNSVPAMIAKLRSRINETYCLRRADVAVVCGWAQLGVAQWSRDDSVEIRFCGSEGDQLRNLAVISRVRAGSPRAMGVGAGSVDLMLELMAFYFF